jgi:hypothetical protein
MLEVVEPRRRRGFGLASTHGLSPESSRSLRRIATAVGASGTVNGRAVALSALWSLSRATGTVQRPASRSNSSHRAPIRECERNGT